MEGYKGCAELEINRLCLAREEFKYAKWIANNWSVIMDNNRVLKFTFTTNKNELKYIDANITLDRKR